MDGNNAVSEKSRRIRGGLYLVVDPAKGIEQTLPIVTQAIAGGVNIIQVWNHWLPGQDKEQFIQVLCTVAHHNNIPVLINEEWELLSETELDGVHFDELPENMEEVQQQIGRSFIIGLTCGNDLEKVKQAIRWQCDYVSFCSVFPSTSANSCEWVKPETIRAARALTGMPLFASGGITPQNILELAGTGIDGVAVISGIMSAPDPQQKASEYKLAIQHINQFTT